MIKIGLTAFKSAFKSSTQSEFSSYDLEFRDSWSELTLEEGITLSRLCERFPVAVQGYYSDLLEGKDELAVLMKKEADLSIEEKAKTLPQLYAEILLVLIAPQDREVFTHQLLPYMSPRYVEKLYDTVALPLALGILFFPPAEQYQTIIDAGHFTLDGVSYQLPRSREIPLGDRTIQEYMADVTAVEFCETADLDLAARQLNAGKLEYAANIVAILCRPAGESYDERQSLQRVPLFRQKLTMDVVWAVFFYTVQQYGLLIGYTHIYSKAAQVGTVKAVKAETLPI